MTRSLGDPTVIVGGGLTGISAAIHLDVDQAPYLMVERTDALGGLARTEERDGFFFDVTGHWLHLRDPEIKALVMDLMEDDLVLVKRISRIVSNGVQTRYPFQGNLHGLPPQVAYDCLLGFIQAKTKDVAGEPANFEDYILRHFGAGIAEHFMIPYNTKLWGVHPREITSAWCSRFVPIPSLEQVVAGALGAGPAELGYNVSFYYPRQGGIETFSSALAGKVDPARVQLNTSLTRVDPAARTVTLGDGEPRPYAALISTMPLPDLVGCLVDPPTEVRDAARRLRATTLRYLNVATRTQAPSDYHWAYIPEERFPFYRVGVFSNAVASMAPPGCSSLYVELASREAPSSHAALLKEVAPALVEVGALTAAEDLLFADERVIDHAYVVFDQHYHAALETIFPYLEAQRIYSRGRYGSWIYNSMEDSLIAGREVARTVSARIAEDRASDPTRQQRM
jgi:protoporphyrinogen oxidase